MTTAMLKSGLTCLTCRLIFENGTSQKHHYSTKWHLYNVKRKVAELPPVSERDFIDKQQHISQNSTTKSITTKDFCASCHKKFQSENAYENHLASKKHQLAAKEDQSNIDLVESKEGEIIEEKNTAEKANGVEKAIPINQCLYCNSTFRNLASTIQHMSFSHGFFIPDHQYCIDLAGLIKYLRLKIGVGKMCIFCNSSKFLTLDALQKHMRDKNHCAFRIDENEETIVEFMDFYDYSDMYEDGADSQNITLYDDGGFFLTLPSGARIGHRSLMRYFKQSLKPLEYDENGQIKDVHKLKKKQIGFAGFNGDLQTVKQNALQLAKKDRTFMEQKIQYHRLKLQKNNNKIFVSKGRKDQM